MYEQPETAHELKVRGTVLVLVLNETLEFRAHFDIAY